MVLGFGNALPMQCNGQFARECPQCCGVLDMSWLALGILPNPPFPQRDFPKHFTSFGKGLTVVGGGGFSLPRKEDNLFSPLALPMDQIPILRTTYVDGVKTL